MTSELEAGPTSFPAKGLEVLYLSGGMLRGLRHMNRKRLLWWSPRSTPAPGLLSFKRQNRFPRSALGDMLWIRWDPSGLAAMRLKKYLIEAGRKTTVPFLAINCVRRIARIILGRVRADCAASIISAGATTVPICFIVGIVVQSAGNCCTCCQQHGYKDGSPVHDVLHHSGSPHLR